MDTHPRAGDRRPDGRKPGDGSVAVSIVIPTLNEGEGIALAVERAWLAGADEVLVVDGGSRDGTLAAAQQAGGRAMPAERGRGQQLRVGAEAAIGDVLLFLHADNHLAAGALDQVRNVLFAGKAVQYGWGAFRQRIEAPGFKYRLLERGNDLRARCGRPYGDQGIFVLREVLQQAGGVPAAPLMEDVLLTARLRRLARHVLLPGPIFVSPRRWERHGVVRQTLHNWSLLAALKLGASPESLARRYRPHGGD